MTKKQKHSEKDEVPPHQNFVHKHMQTFNKCVAHGSAKDYDRRQRKQQLKDGLDD